MGKINAFQALKDISLTVEESEMFAIIGKSGAGKSTLMHIIGCIDDFESGTYIFIGEDILKIRENRRVKIRNRDIGIVMQDFARVEDYTAIENVMIPLYFSKEKSNESKKTRAMKTLEKKGNNGPCQ